MIAKMLAGLLIACALARPVPAWAEVRSVEREGFTIHISQEVAATPDTVFSAFTRPADWWDSAHSWSGDAQNMRMEAQVGGCWCETLPQNGGVEHGRIISYNPVGRSMIMASLLGPLQSLATSGVMSWRVEPAEREGYSRISWGYRVATLPSGNPAQDAALAAGVDFVLRQQIARLAARVTGAPMPAQPS